MAGELTPVYAAKLADDVYDIKSSITREDFLDEYKADMEIARARFSTGISGGYILNRKHVMAVLSAGKGKYNGQAFIAIKGTASLYDVLTDLNTGVRSSHTGFPIHQGFYYAFDSILADVRKFISGLRGVHVIHCVGHSMGGAVATLTADWIKASSAIPSVKLYTFGSPRVGLENFASKCTSRLGTANIYRVHHRTDPVAMVPTWPFYHVANGNYGYLIDSPTTVRPWEYHLMKHYRKSVQRAGSWSRLASSRPATHLDAAIERWLKSDGVLSFTAASLELLEAALLYVIKKVVHGAGIAIVGSAAVGLTLLDRMAIFLARAAKVASDVSIWVYHLIRRMAALIGIKIREGTSLSVEFIRMVFLRLYRRIADTIRYIGRELA